MQTFVPDVGEEQHIARESLLGVDDDRQRLEVHEHEPGGVDAFGSTLGDDDGDDVADETHDVVAPGTVAPSPGRARESAEAGTSPDRHPPP